MKKINAAITAVGKYLPEYILNNIELEKLVNTSDSWIFERTGIKERRILKDKDKATSFLAIKAAENLIKKKGLNPEEIDLVLIGTATSDMVIIPTASYVATKIGAKKAFSFDLQAACSSFLYSISTASAYIESGRYKKILLIGADKMSSIVDYQDRTTCIIFGDAGAAALLEPDTDGFGFQNEYLKTDGIGRDFLNMKAGGSLNPASYKTVKYREHYVKQEGKAVFKHAVSNMSDAIVQILKKNNLTNEDIDWLVPHQANMRIIEAISDKINFDKKKVMTNIKYYGNTTSATLPLLLCDYENKLKRGDKLILAAFGGGFTWGATYLKWAYDS